MKDVFRIMGVEPGAPPDVIRRAYRDLVRVWHPDRFPNDARLRSFVEERLKEINTAYDLLMKGMPPVREEPPPGRQGRRTRASRANNRPETLPLGGTVTITLLPVPGGAFPMGSRDGDPDEGPVRRVSVSPFLLGRTTVTGGQYSVVMGENPSRFFGDADLPVEQVSWEDAARFCNRLSDLAGLEPCYREIDWFCDFSADGYRLPTEAEWEYACRAGSTSAFSCGDDESALVHVAWFKTNSGGRTHPVGQKKPNAWGFHDMHGNVWEWTNDWFGQYPERQEADPVGPSAGVFRVKRGGGWFYEAFQCRSTYRSNFAPHFRDHLTGFRIARRG